MPGERAIIDIMDRLLPQGRRNRCHECDCEIIDLDDKQYLFTTDEFSAEDRFIESDPRVLGWNIAAGALSDVYACGGQPLYFAHALTVSFSWNERFIGGLGQGIADALTVSGARFIGGDCGQSEQWRCTATVIGKSNGNPLTRIGSMPGDAIYITGRIGMGNLQAALSLLKLPKLSLLGLRHARFRIRENESTIIKRYASSCIDTSDGAWKALTIIADLNKCGYAIDRIPYSKAGVIVAKTAGLPPILLFLGECGEYELLCTIPAKREAAFLQEAKTSGSLFFRLGVVTRDTRTVDDGNHTLDMSAFHLEARDYPHARDYLSALTDWYKKQGSRS
jgi:thiamine-monophosphate kinase